MHKIKGKLFDALNQERKNAKGEVKKERLGLLLNGELMMMINEHESVSYPKLCMFYTGTSVNDYDVTLFLTTS